MSINVTIHKNLYNFGRDNKMISDFDFIKKQELERRKRLRLEQVRQQSKVLAKNLRNRYDEEKQRQEKCLEDCKARELKLWQQKNIEKLQAEYERCLKNVGKAHKAAKQYENKEKLQEAKKMAQRATAIRRGLQAAEKLKRDQDSKKKKKIINKLKQKTVSIQTEFGSSMSDSEASRILDDEHFSSENEEELDRIDYLNPERPFNNKKYKPNASKIILSSSSEDEEEIKILSDMTSEENERKRYEIQMEQKKKPASSIDPNYDRISSDYRSIPLQSGRPFSQISEFLRKRTEPEEPLRRPVLAELNNYQHVLDESRTLMDKEKLQNLVKSPKKIQASPRKHYAGPGPSYKSVQRQPVNTQFQPSVQRVSNVIDRERRQGLAKNSPSKRPPRAIPNQGRADVAAERERVRKDYVDLSNKLDKLVNDERHLKAYDTPEYNYSTVKLAKDAQARQRRMEKAFNPVMNQPAIITCPKVTAPPQGASRNRPGPSINVADIYRDKSNKSKPASRVTAPPEAFQEEENKYPSNTPVVNIPSQNRPSARLIELDRIVNLERLKDLLETINEQKQLLLQAIEQNKSIPDLKKYKDVIDNLEIQRERLMKERENIESRPKQDVETNTSKTIADLTEQEQEKAKIAKEKQELKKRELKLKELECRLENEMKKLYKKSKEAEAKKELKKPVVPIQITTQNLNPKDIQIIEESTSTTTPSSSMHDSGDNIALAEQKSRPVKIVINVNDYVKTTNALKMNSDKILKQVSEKLNEKTGKVYPKTPSKKPILKKSSIDTDAKVTKDDPISLVTTDKNFKEHQIVTDDDRKSPEVSGASGSTVYRDPPSKVKTEFTKFLERVHAETVEESKAKLQQEQLKAKQKSSKPSEEPLTAKQPAKHSTVPSKSPQTSDPKENNFKLNPSLMEYISRLLGMTRSSIDQLGVSSGSEIPTPNSSVMNISSNIGPESTSASLDHVERLKRFVLENNSFIKEVDQALSKKRLNGTAEENKSVVENVWEETLKKKEDQMKKKQAAVKKQIQKVVISPQKKRISRTCNEPEPKKKVSKPIQKSKLDGVTIPPPPRMSRICSQPERNYRNSTISSTTRSKSISPRKERTQKQRKEYVVVSDDESQKRRVRSTSPPTRSLPSPVTVSTISPNQPKSILKSPRRQLTANINQIIGEVESLRVGGKDEGKILDKYAELTENCSKRISELANLIDRARVEKRMVLELSFTSTDQPNSTEYLDVPVGQNTPAVTNDDPTSPETVSYQEDNVKPMTQMQQIGKSRDSGISMSRPVTSCDFRGSTDQVSTQGSPPDFVPMLKDIPRVNEVEKFQDNSAEQLRDELRKFGVYLNDLDNSMTKLSTGFQQKQRGKPPTSIKRYSPQLLEKELPHELSTIVEAETSAASKLNASQDKVSQLKESGNVSLNIRPEDFPSYDEYLKACVEQFTQDTLETTDYIKKMLHNSTHTDKLDYNRFPSILDAVELPSELPKNEQSKADNTDIFLDLSGELKRRRIIDRPFREIDFTNDNGTSGDSDILSFEREVAQTIEQLRPIRFEEHSRTPQKKSSPKKNPVSPRKLKQFETRVVQKTPEKSKENQEELDDTVPNTPTKPKAIQKKRTPKKDSPRTKKSTEEKNFSGFTYLQKSLEDPQLDKEMAQMGIQWAASTIRRSQQAQALSTSSTTSDSSPITSTSEKRACTKRFDITSRTTPSDLEKQPTKPIGLKEFLTRELMIRSQTGDSSNESSLSSQFLKSLMNISSSTSTSANGHTNATLKRTSTPLQGRSSSSSQRSLNKDGPPSESLFSGESRLSSVHGSDSSKENKKQTLQPPNIQQEAEKYASTSHSE